MKTIGYKILASIVIFSFLIGCKTTKDSLVKDIPQRSKSELLEALYKHNYDYNWWTGKASVRLKSPFQSGSGKLHLRIKKDSLIWLVGKKLSIEGVRAQITPDQYSIIFRQENTYQQGLLHSLERQWGIPLVFEDLQNLLVGNIFLPDTVSNNEIHQEGSKYIILSNIDGMKVTYTMDAFYLRLTQVDIQHNPSQHTSIQYKDYKKIENHDIAHDLIIKYANATDVSSLSVQFNKVEIDIPKKTPFSIPSHYKKIHD